LIAECIAEFVAVGSAGAPRYAALTFPLYRELVGTAGTIAIGAEIAGQAAGLALARADGAVLSIAVTRPWRRQGIAGMLLALMEDELRARQCRVARCTWMTGTPSTQAIEALLRRAHWDEPVPRMLVCRVRLTAVLEAPWMKNPPPLSDAAIRPWIEVPKNERDSLAPDAGENCEPANSLALYAGGRLSGCVVTHRIADNLLRYSNLMVLPQVERSGLAIALLATSIHRHPVMKSPADEVGIWDVRMDNRPMLNVVRRRLQPYLEHVAKTMGSRKVL
jgi:GNAT superfamily N-acetyltransferase